MRDVVGFLRARLRELEADAPSVHARRCASNQSEPKTCDCGYPALIRTDVLWRREMIDEFVHWLESESSTNRERSRTHEALLVMAQPWAERSDFDPYWRLDLDS